MHIKDKLNMDRKGLETYGPITIVAFGDSVTHGCFAGGDIDYDAVYWNVLRQRINAVRNYVPVNVINAAVGGTSAKKSLERLDKQVLKHEPDLVIVCFGLNDVNGELKDFLDALREIFPRCKAAGADVIYLSPNMLNTSVAEDTEQRWWEYAHKTAEMQNGGRMDTYIEGACTVARECGVAVCDCYAEWKKLSQTQDVTTLLCNRINHPSKEMHVLFADKLFECIFNEQKDTAASESGMYEEEKT